MRPLILSPLTKSLCSRYALPTAVGYITLGLVIGAVVRTFGDTSASLDPHTSFNGVFETLAQLGIVALLFRIGLNSHTSALIEKLPDASLIWIGNIGGSFAVGYLVSRHGLAWSVETSLAIATAFSATSVAVSASVWGEMGKLNTSQGQILVDVAELDDILLPFHDRAETNTSIVKSFVFENRLPPLD